MACKLDQQGKLCLFYCCHYGHCSQELCNIIPGSLIVLIAQLAHLICC